MSVRAAQVKEDCQLAAPRTVGQGCGYYATKKMGATLAAPLEFRLESQSIKGLPVTALMRYFGLHPLVTHLHPRTVSRLPFSSVINPEK